MARNIYGNYYEDTYLKHGCLGIYFSRYDDGSLMLYTEREFAAVMKRSLESGGGNPIGNGSQNHRGLL